MRKVMCLVAMISGFAMGCGESDSKETVTDPVDEGNNGNNGNNGGNNGIDIPDAGSLGGEDEKPYPECPREMIPAMFDPYMGPKTMTQAGYMECSTKCGQDNACYNEMNCPGVDAFNECLNAEVIACSAKAKGMCREEYENFVCCADASKCGQTDNDCIQSKCGTEIGKIQPCISGDTACLQTAGGSCFAPPAAAPAASIGSGARSAISAESLQVLLQNVNLSR